MARAMGRALGEQGAVVVTGAPPGLPHEAALGAKEAGALTIGISPALSLDQHRQVYRSPVEPYDVLVFTGSGLMGREVEIIRTCEAVVVIGGRSGTLGEFAIAYDEAKLIAVLEGTGGVADHIAELVRIINKQTGAEIVSDPDPQTLCARMMARHQVRLRNGLAHRGPIVHDG